MSQAAQEAFSGFAKEGGRVGSGLLGSGTGGVARCVR
jgi:sulfate adenylyltransferase subunit 1